MFLEAIKCCTAKAVCAGALARFAAIRLKLSSSDKMRWHVPYDSTKMLQTSWIVRLRSSRITSRTFATFSGVVPIEGRPELSSSSTDVRPFLNRLNYL
jgi:hypothetical protein